MTLFWATLRIKLSLPATTTLVLPLALAGIALTAVRAEQHPTSSRTVSISDLGRTAADIAKAQRAKPVDDAKTDDVNGTDTKSSDVDQLAPAATDLSAKDSPKESLVAKDPYMGHDGKPLTPELASLGAKIRRTLATYQPKHLNARDNTCWEVMHNLIAFGPGTEIFRDGPGGQTVNAMGWLCWGGRCQGQPLIVLENHAPHALYGVGLEGHGGQYLAMLAQWRVRPESPMRIGGVDFSVADYIEEEKATCESGTELTFKLLALSHYLPSDATWISRNGETWDIPKLLKAEIEAPVHGAACGGSHRLFAIASALKERLKRGEPIDGQYIRAAKYIADYQRYALGSLQNPDGSFSTEWFNYPADRPGDWDRKIQTTGHMLEFLVFSLPDSQLRDPRVIKAVDFISSLMLYNPDRAWSIGPMGHALHAQMIYHERMFNQPALPSTSLTAAVPMPVKAKPTGIMPNPSEPDCEGLPGGSMHDLQNVTQQPEPFNLHSSVSSHSSDSADGCVESIPGATVPTVVLKSPKLNEGDIREAMKGAGPLLAPVGDDAAETVRE